MIQKGLAFDDKLGIAAAAPSETRPKARRKAFGSIVQYEWQ